MVILAAGSLVTDLIYQARGLTMVRGCPATGRMTHKFDKATHRCVCGRWDRGYKPKVEPVRPRDECQICARQQALDGSGCMVHHGYRRPGWGCIQGDCYGVGYRPYPATDALAGYLVAVRNHIEACVTKLAAIPALASIEHVFTTGIGRARTEHTITIQRGEEERYDAASRHSFPSFADLIRRRIAHLEKEIQFATADAQRAQARIDAARPTTQSGAASPTKPVSRL